MSINEIFVQRYVVRYEKITYIRFLIPDKHLLFLYLQFLIRYFAALCDINGSRYTISNFLNNRTEFMVSIYPLIPSLLALFIFICFATEVRKVRILDRNRWEHLHLYANHCELKDFKNFYILVARATISSMKSSVIFRKHLSMVVIMELRFYSSGFSLPSSFSSLDRVTRAGNGNFRMSMFQMDWIWHRTSREKLRLEEFLRLKTNKTDSMTLLKYFS